VLLELICDERVHRADLIVSWTSEIDLGFILRLHPLKGFRCKNTKHKKGLLKLLCNTRQESYDNRVVVVGKVNCGFLVDMFRRNRRSETCFSVHPKSLALPHNFRFIIIDIKINR